MRIYIILAAVAAFLYLIYEQSQKTACARGTLPAAYTGQGCVAATLVTPSTQIPYQGPLSFFSSPSPIISNGNLLTQGVMVGPKPAAGSPGPSVSGFVTTGPTVAQAELDQPGFYPLTPASPSLIQSLQGSPAVGIDTVSDVNPAIDYPGIQTYMSDPYAIDPNQPIYSA